MEKKKVAVLLSYGPLIGAVLFIAAFIILAGVRPGYSSVSCPISLLAIGPDGVYMRTAFLLNGILLFAGVPAFLSTLKSEGLFARLASGFLLALSPVGMLWAGVFTMNQLKLHLIGAQLACAAPVFAFLIVGIILLKIKTWRWLSKWLFIASLLTVVFLAGFMQSVPFSEMATGGGLLGL